MAKQKTESKALATWDQELADEAKKAAGQEAGGGGGSFIGTRGGILTVDSTPVPGNTLAAVILDSVMLNTFYEGAYDPDNPQPPVCYAFGRKDDEMGPHDKCSSKQHEQCKGCPNNEFGSAIRFNGKGQQVEGKGKACKNTRRLAVIPAGTFGKDGSFEAYNKPSAFSEAEPLFLSVPPTSIKGYAGFVTRLAASANRPPWAVFTKIGIVADPKSQFKLTFEPLAKAPDTVLPALREASKAAKALIEFPFPDVREEAPKPTGKKRF